MLDCFGTAGDTGVNNGFVSGSMITKERISTLTNFTLERAVHSTRSESFIQGMVGHEIESEMAMLNSVSPICTTGF